MLRSYSPAPGSITFSSVGKKITAVTINGRMNSSGHLWMDLAKNSFRAMALFMTLFIKCFFQYFFEFLSEFP